MRRRLGCGGARQRSRCRRDDVNFYLLALVGRLILAARVTMVAQSVAGMLLPPVKLFFFITVIYLIVESG